MIFSVLRAYFFYFQWPSTQTMLVQNFGSFFHALFHLEFNNAKKSQKEISETSPAKQKAQMPVSNQTILTHIPLEEATDQSEEQGKGKEKKKIVNINDSYKNYLCNKVRWLLFLINPSKRKLTEVSCLIFLIKSWAPYYLLFLHITSIALELKL